MGRTNSKIRVRQDDVIEEARPRTPLELWNSSEHTHEDMLIFMETSETFEGWLPTVSTFLRSISHR